MHASAFLKPKHRWLIGLVVTTTAIAGGTVYFALTQMGGMGNSAQVQSVQAAPTISKVTALGRLEPQTEVIRLSAPLTLDGDRVAQILVMEGERVKQGQVVAILDSRDRLYSALLQAQEQVRVAQSQLAQVRAGAKSGEIQAQSALIARLQAELQGEITTQAATIARLQAEVNNARTEYNRFRQLAQEGAISASNLDGKRLTLDTAEAQLREAIARQTRTADTLKAQIQEARATLSRIAEVRPVDVRAAQAEVTLALAALRQAKAKLDQTLVRSPISGEVLDIYTRAGEVVGSDGIAEIGQTRKMQVIAEVYQSDVRQLRLGQTVQISSDALPKPLTGTVALIGSQVRRQMIINTDPTSNIDARVVEVWIALDPENSQLAAKFTNLQVKVVIQK